MPTCRLRNFHYSGERNDRRLHSQANYSAIQGAWALESLTADLWSNDEQRSVMSRLLQGLTGLDEKTIKQRKLTIRSGHKTKELRHRGIQWNRGLKELRHRGIQWNRGLKELRHYFFKNSTDALVPDSGSTAAPPFTATFIFFVGPRKDHQ